MKTSWMFVLLSVASLLVMAAVDSRLGAKAEFLNAWSVIERLLGRTPSAGDSAVVRMVGPLGELAAVVVVNLVIGGILALLIGLVSKKG
jgi:hypothetical protein